MKPTAHNSLTDLPWSSQDWSQPNTSIAATLGCCHTSVRHYRQIHAPRPPKNATPWHTVTDWAAKSNATIAAELGVPRATVESYRWKHKLPHGPRSPGTGLHRQSGKPKPLTLHAKAQRLEAVWACLWPDDPMNLRRLDEVAAIKQQTCCAQLP